jgi:Rrf2 family protein
VEYYQGARRRLIPQEKDPMKLSRASSYALTALVGLARERDGHQATSSAIADANGISEGLLLHALAPLVSAGALWSAEGPNGNYALARPAKEITLLEIIEAVDGPIRDEVPPSRQGAAHDAQLHEVCDRVAVLLRAWLAKVTVAELAKGK